MNYHVVDLDGGRYNAAPCPTMEEAERWLAHYRRQYPFVLFEIVKE